jgi:hypothetical protein
LLETKPHINAIRYFSMNIIKMFAHFMLDINND